MIIGILMIVRALKINLPNKESDMSEDHGFVSEIEQELLDATGFVPEKKYKRRQDYLGALLRAVSELADEDYDKLTDEAAAWCDSAVLAHKASKALPDFENGATEHFESEHQTSSGEDEDSEADTVASASSYEDEGSSIEDDEKKEKKKRGRPKGSKAKVKTKDKDKVVKAKKEPREKKGKIASRGNNDWGVGNGTKSDLVCRMLAQEGGTTMRDIVQATGQAHYNLVHRLQRHGHTVVKDGLNLRLFHKDRPKN